MKLLLKLTALIEVGAGLALLIAPALVVKLLLGEEISGAAIPLARVAGTALLALGVACGCARGNAKGLVTAMLVYNVGAVVIFLFAGLGSKMVGIALWPAVILHAAMAVWCAAAIKCYKTQTVQD
jgi:hypothetical protein